MPLLTHVIVRGDGHPRILFLVNGDLTYYKARVRRNVIQTVRAHIAYQFSEQYLKESFEFIVYQPIVGQCTDDRVPFMFEKEQLDPTQPILMSYSVLNMKLALRMSAEMGLLGVPYYMKDHARFALQRQWKTFKPRRDLFLLDYYSYGWGRAPASKAHTAILRYQQMLAMDALQRAKKLGVYKVRKTKQAQLALKAEAEAYVRSWKRTADDYNDATAFLEAHQMAQDYHHVSYPRKVEKPA